jgi:hypothetical protein
MPDVTEAEIRIGICRCGSGLFSWWMLDARGIPCCRVCEKCEAKAKKKYRPEILTGYNQDDVDEPIEPEE